jgi:hypothetical protein
VCAIASAKALAFAAALLLSAATPGAAETIRAADLAATVGVNVHLEYTDGGYADAGAATKALKFVGVNLVRDAAPDPHNQGQASYGALARAGVRFDLFVNGGDIATAIGGLTALEAQYRGAVHAIEGPNEINNHATFGFAGLTDKHRAATAYQAALYAAVKATPILNAIPVLAFTDYPATPGPCDIANFHSYPDGPGAPGERLAQDGAEALAVAPGKPLVDTEFGYFTQPIRRAVSQRSQARLILTGLLDNAARGVRETYIYQLLDAYPDASAQDSEKHYGLFDINDRPKVSAQMLRRLMQLLHDDSPNAHTFPLRFERFAIQGLPATARTLVIEKASGETLIAIWNETPVWDAIRGVDLEGPKTELVLTTSGNRSARISDVVDGAATAAVTRTPIHLVLGTSPVFVRLLASARPAAISW